MRMAQTRGGKKFWRGWSASTKGWQAMAVSRKSTERQKGEGKGKAEAEAEAGRRRNQRDHTYHEQSPEGVIEEDNRGSHEHGGAYEFVKLRWAARERVLATFLLRPSALTWGAWNVSLGHTIVREIQIVILKERGEKGNVEAQRLALLRDGNVGRTMQLRPEIRCHDCIAPTQATHSDTTTEESDGQWRSYDPCTPYKASCTPIQGAACKAAWAVVPAAGRALKPRARAPPTFFAF